MRTRVRLYRKERRRLILEAAKRIVGNNDPAVLALRDVADACEVPTSLSLVKHYFPGGRKALLRALAQRKRGS